MPGIIPKYDVNDKNINEVGDAERKARIDTIRRLWAYYDGNHKKPLKIEPGETDDNILINLSGRVIDKTVEFMGMPAKIELPGAVNSAPAEGDAPTVETRSADQMKLDDFWEHNDLAEFVEDMEQSGSIAGHVFLKLTDGEEPSIALLDPCYVTVFWNISNIKQCLFYRLQWAVGRTHYRQDIVPNWLLKGLTKPSETYIDIEENVYDDGMTWKILEYSKPEMRQRWDLIAQDDWNYPFSPIVEWKNRRRAHQYYGESDLRAPELNDAINFIASNTGRIIKYHAHPTTVGLGFSANVIEETSVSGFLAIPVTPDTASVTNLEMQSDLSSSLNFLNLLRTEFFATHRVVDVASIKDKLGQITNFGVRMLFSDQIDNTDSKRSIYGPGIGEASRRLLWLMGAQHEEQPVVEWDNPLPVNRLEQLQAAQIEAGLETTSKQTIAEDLGRDYDKEKQEMKREGDDASQKQADNILRMQQMGAAF